MLNLVEVVAVDLTGSVLEFMKAPSIGLVLKASKVLFDKQTFSDVLVRLISFLQAIGCNLFSVETKIFGGCVNVWNGISEVSLTHIKGLA